MKLNEIIKKSIDGEEKNRNLNPNEYDKVWNKIEFEIDKRDSTISERIKRVINSFRDNFKLPFSYKDVIQIAIFITIVVGIPFSISHYNKSYKKNVHVDSILEQNDTIDKENKGVMLTIEKIKESYKEILNVKEFNNHYVLVQYSGEFDGTSFDLYNLKTGHKDLVTTGFPKLIKIVNENEFLFLESGQSLGSPYWVAPSYLRCIRVKQIANTEGSFKAVREEAYFNVDESMVFGDKNSDMISKVDSVDELLSVTFSPVPGKEANFMAAYSNVPVTTTSYIKDKNQLVVEFKDCETEEKLIEGKRNISDNEFISGYEIIKNKTDSKLIIDLKSKAKAYNCSTADLANGLVKLNIKFISKEEQSNLLNENKSLEAILKSYNYSITMNSGFGFEIEIPQSFEKSSELKGLYLQYCNELSKAIGYDISTLSEETVEIKGYGVTKAGDKSKVFDVISVILKGEIYGLWIRENETGTLLSLTGESFPEITKKSWQQLIVEKGIKVNNKDIDNEFKNITLSELFYMGSKK